MSKPSKKMEEWYARQEKIRSRVNALGLSPGQELYEKEYEIMQEERYNRAAAQLKEWADRGYRG